MKRTKSGKILLHSETELDRRTAEAINDAVGKIGPIQVAGLEIAKSMERAEAALDEGIEKIEQIDKHFKDKIPDGILEAAADPDLDLEQEIAALKIERDHLKEENAKLREKINFLSGKK